MPHEGEGLPVACESTLHLAFPRQGPGPAERDLNPEESPPGPSASVPEIEIKLESSDDEDEEFDRNESCSFPHVRKSSGMSGLMVGQKERGNVPDFGRSDAVEYLPRSSGDNPGPFAIRPIRKRKVKSEVWQFFYRDANNVCRAVCSICRISVSRGKLGGNFGTTALKRHLESKHPMEWAQRESMRLQRRDEDDDEAFEEKEPNEKIFSGPGVSYRSHQTSKYGTVGSSETYEIIDSSDDEDDDKVKGEVGQVKPDEETEMKGVRMLARADLVRRNLYQGLLFDPDARAKFSKGMANARDFSYNSDPSLAPPETKKRRSTSAVWQFFYIDHRNVCRAICTMCYLSVSRGTQGSNLGTSALIRHLEVKHPLEWGKVKLDKPKIVPVIEVEDEEDDDEAIDLYPQQQAPCGQRSLPGYREYAEASASPTPGPPAMPLEYDPGIGIGKSEEELLTLPSLEDQRMVPNHSDLTCSGKYTPNHPKVQAWTRNIAELVCGLALPYSFINSRAFQKFMERADPLYSLPPRSFFSGKAIPQMYEAVCKQVAGDLKRSECPHVHVAAHVWSVELPMNFLALTAHWAVFDSGDQPSIVRKHAVLCVKSFPKEFNESNVQQELVRQNNLWLSPNALSPGFFISSGDFSLIHAIKGANFTYISSFPHSLNLLILDFLQSNRYITSMLAVARKVCSHFAHSAWAGKRLRELQQQYNLPKHSLKLEMVHHWTSTFYMLQRLLEQQRAVQEYLAKHTLEAADDLLTASHWKLMVTLVYLLEPFEMATREANAGDCSLSQVLPGIRYLHIFLRQIRGHFESKGDSTGVVLADGFAFKFSSDYGLNEMFQREEYVLATLLDPRFKGRIEAILPPGSDINHWKQVLVKKVKEVMSSSGPVYPPEMQFKPDPNCDSELPNEKREEPAWRDVAAPLLIQKDKSLIEHLESVGLMASKSTGASLSTESHSASVMVEKYLQDNKTIGAKEDPLGYWEKRRWLWPHLTKLAVMYLTCPPSSIFAEHVFKSFHSPLDTRRSLEMMEGLEHVAFLKTNLENFPHYTPPPLVCSSDNEEEQSDGEGGF